ncbi:PD-(D/E)XK nuclease family protein [Nitrosomonas marina]|uniref:Probable DNA repair protein n=1 Tax=Nitrosomonas marina TaxID=917 RepID=A0A1H8EHJ3_9PROT|nr:PD-(D/E)XK nuclease family protein [Nitrosomonas marina]SEN18594.1 probable DNA repair protein [Nitrosomonas marina]
MKKSLLLKQLSFQEFFRHLNSENAAAVSVVTPNRRLAQVLKDCFSREQSNRQNAAWRTPDILPINAFTERIYQEAVYSIHSVEIPLLLTVTQAHALWQTIIQTSETGSKLLNTMQTAQSAYEAWQIVHAWRLTSDMHAYYLNDDCSAFQEWMEQYQSVLRENQYIDPACLVDLIVELCTQIEFNRPDNLYCYGFELLTPQQCFLLSKLQALGSKIHCVIPPYLNHQETGNANIARVSCRNTQEEIYQAATWARSRLEADCSVSIGVVVPALTNCRSTVQRIFQEVMQPDVRDALPQAQSQQKDRPFNISLGLPLTAYPVVDLALSVLALVQRGLTFDRASNLLRSPYIKGGDNEMHQRAMLCMQMRQKAEPFVTLEQLVSLLNVISQQSEQNTGNCQIQNPVLLEIFTALLSFSQTDIPHRSHHATYARLFLQMLQIVGFPGERALNSTEYQTAIKWQEVVADFATLDCVQESTSCAAAVEKLNAVVANTLFQPQTPHTPIQILGVMEAAGMVFDHLWVLGLSEEHWPMPSRPNPFLPYELQKKAGIPMKSTDEALNYSRQLQKNWLRGAKEVVLSHPVFSDGADAQAIAPSSLIRGIPERTAAEQHYKLHRDLIVDAARVERIIDHHVNLSKVPKVTGGTAVIKDYAACPFRAWAKHRLRVMDKDRPHVGFNARERGLLVHRVLHLLWQELKSKETLDTVLQTDLEKILCSVASRAIEEIGQWRPCVLSKRYRALEHQRLIHLMREWLDIEKKRDSFSIAATEKKYQLQLGDLALQVRVDRVDRLANGQFLIIDYKTRSYSISSMLGERLDEPQLPLYLVMTESDGPAVAGIAFAAINPGQMGFSAIVNETGLLPGVKAFSELAACAQFSTWHELTTKWKQDLTDLANGFISGDARVLPKRFPLTCQYCDLQALCRIHERFKNPDEE